MLIAWIVVVGSWMYRNSIGLLGASERQSLRATFESTADTYQRARPDYPTELIDDLLRSTGLVTGDSLLEVGCATGKATLPLASLGFGITCVELGKQLAVVARRNLAAFP